MATIKELPKPKVRASKNFKFLTDKIDEWLGKSLKMNFFSKAIEVCRKLEWDEEEFDPETGDPFPEDSEVYFRKWTSKDDGYLKRKFDYNWPKLNFSSTMIYEGIEFIASTNEYNPVKEHIKNLPEWDEIPRLDTWLIDYCKATWPSKELICTVGRKFVLGMVKRAYFPGTKFDYMLILEGAQGIGKSTIARILAGHEDFFTDTYIGDFTDSRRTIENYAGKLVVEFAELASLNKTEIELLKGYITSTHDRGRLAYGRHVSEIPRSFVFVGTTNETRYLTDPTGTRRYWPIMIKKVDIEGLKLVRDQILAEAFYIISNDMDTHLLESRDEIRYEKLKQSRHAITNVKFLMWIKSNWSILKEYEIDGVIEGNQLFQYCIEIFEGNVSTKQYSMCLQLLGATKTRTNGGIYWILPEEPERIDIS